MPGHFLVWKDGKIAITEYWNLEYEPKHIEVSDDEFIEQWLTEFKKAVELRLMADVPLGMFLSGGIDSSAIAAVMSEMVSEPIKPFQSVLRSAKRMNSNTLAWFRKNLELSTTK